MIELFRFFDKYLGTPICLSLTQLERLKSFFQPHPTFDPQKIKRILVIKTVALGDLILLLPTLKALKETFPEACLTLLTTPRVREVVEGQNFIDEIIYFDPTNIGSLKNIFQQLREGNFTLVVEAEHYYRFTTIISYLIGAPWRVGFALPRQGRKGLFNIRVPYRIDLHEVENFYQLAVAVGAKRKREIKLEPVVVSRADQEKVRDFLRKEGIQRYEKLIILHPSTSPRATSRRWESEKWAELAEILHTKGFRLIISGSSAEDEAVKEVEAKLNFNPVVSAGKLNLKQFAVLLKRAVLFVGVDTGALHLAAAEGTPVLGLYGPNTPRKWGPYGVKSKTIYHPLNCSPCIRQYQGVVYNCSQNLCLQKITVEEVFQAAMELLKSSAE